MDSYLVSCELCIFLDCSSDTFMFDFSFMIEIVYYPYGVVETVEITN